MAGLGRKTFTAGEVLTAANVQGYLMDQSVGVFASSTARSSALGTAVSAGMVSYRSDDKALELYAGSAWQPVMAGKNAIINGSLEINQRSFTTSTINGYTFDRFTLNLAGDGTSTGSSQTLSPATLNVSGFGDVRNYFRFVTTGQTNAAVRSSWIQPVEDVRTLAGQTVTYSFWARAASGTPKIFAEAVQQFGDGGSTAVITPGGTVTISTSWARYSITFAIPSISGKTVGNSSYLTLGFWVSAGTDFASRTNSLGIQTNTFDIWGVQLEAGSVATPFVRAAGTLQGELAACQRYYYRSTSDATNRFKVYGQGQGSNATAVQAQIQFPVPLRIAPSAVEFSTLRVADGVASISVSALAMNSTQQSESIGFVTATVSGATGYRPYVLQANDSTSSFIGFSAEL